MLLVTLVSHLDTTLSLGLSLWLTFTLSLYFPSITVYPHGPQSFTWSCKSHSNTGSMSTGTQSRSGSLPFTGCHFRSQCITGCHSVTDLYSKLSSTSAMTQIIFLNLWMYLSQLQHINLCGNMSLQYSYKEVFHCAHTCRDNK